MKVLKKATLKGMFFCILFCVLATSFNAFAVSALLLKLYKLKKVLEWDCLFCLGVCGFSTRSNAYKDGERHTS